MSPKGSIWIDGHSLYLWEWKQLLTEQVRSIRNAELVKKGQKTNSATWYYTADKTEVHICLIAAFTTVENASP